MKQRSGRPAVSAVALMTAFVLFAFGAGCASKGADQDPDLGAYREMLEAQRRRAADMADEKARRPPTVAEKLREGDGLRAAGESGRAMWSYLQAHNLDRDDPAPVARIASLHLKDDPDRAEALFRELTEKHPDSAAAHTGLGLASLAKGRIAQAQTSLSHAVEMDPRSVVALSALGVVSDRLGQHALAQKHYLRALAVLPNDYESLNNLGVSYLLTGQYDEAVTVFRRAALIEARDPAVLNNLGMALGRLERYDEALEAFRRAGDEQAALNNLGYVYYLNGRFEEAIAHYERALLTKGESKVTILRNLRLARDALASKGNTEGASRTGREPAKPDPLQPEAASAGAVDNGTMRHQQDGSASPLQPPPASNDAPAESGSH